MKRTICGITLALVALGTMISLFSIQPAQACPLVGDVNGDKKVDLQDLAIVAYAFGSYPNHPRWNPVADINEDNMINMIDIFIVAQHFGETATKHD